MHIKSAQHQKFMGKDTNHLKVIIDDVEVSVPKDPENTTYAEILKQVKEGTLTIKEAD
tara:strand:+ start:436 stop:609 length:174 start_codon:yes stop_codon:yes gene_type:complete